jgi:hypothetical protein
MGPGIGTWGGESRTGDRRKGQKTKTGGGGGGMEQERG